MSARISVRLPSQLAESIAKEAETAGVSMSDRVRDLLVSARSGSRLRTDVEFDQRAITNASRLVADLAKATAAGAALVGALDAISQRN